MDSKVKHRILGLLVLAGLITIILPVFALREDAEIDVSALKAPPFPDQTIQVNAEDTAQYSTIASRAAGSPLFEERTDLVNHVGDLALRSLHPDINPGHAMTESEIKLQTANLIEVPHANQAIHPIKVVHHTISPAPIAVLTQGKRVINIKDATWAIQMGTFSNKANALRLVNKLRSSGYRAFIHSQGQASASLHTKVFIGPMDKKLAAISLAAKVERELHLHGVVVTYKPLSV